MQDSILIKAPAKINLFLRILDQKEDGYHNIRTGVTFLDLYDEIKISFSNKNNLLYSGPFKPTTEKFDNDIIIKLLNHITLKKKKKINIKIKKNIPYQAGLGSASTNVAALIKGFQILDLINEIDKDFLVQLGSDVPVCYYGKNCLATGIGDKINKSINFPKYYFILVKPKVQILTKEMYKKIKKYNIFDKNYFNQTLGLKTLHEEDSGNDFERIARKENQEIAELLDFYHFLI